jgi:hypothetical protein
MQRTSAAASEPLTDSDVEGTVELVTERPIVLPRQDGPRARIEEFLVRRPLLVPGILLGIVVLLLLSSSRGPRVVVVSPQNRPEE